MTVREHGFVSASAASPMRSAGLRWSGRGHGRFRVSDVVALGRQRGAVSVEAALLVPAFVLVMAVATAGWRVWWAQTQVTAAAQAAARAGAGQASVQQASAVVDSVVASDLVTAALHCSEVVVQDDVTVVGSPVGSPGTVWVSVTCTVGLGDLLVPGLPGSITVVGQASETVDVFGRRGR